MKMVHGSGIHLDGSIIPSLFSTSQWYRKAGDAHLNCVDQERQHVSFPNAILNNFSVDLSAR